MFKTEVAIAANLWPEVEGDRLILYAFLSSDTRGKQDALPQYTDGSQNGKIEKSLNSVLEERYRSMCTIDIKSYEELKTFLRTTDTVSGGDQYDFVGMVALLGACLDNLQTNALNYQTHDLADIADCLSNEQRYLLKRLQKHLDGDR